MNTGIADAVDLGWKLAATLNGWAGDGLLSAYGGERLPIGTRNVNVAAEFYSEEEKLGNGIATIEEDTSAGAQVRPRVGDALIRDVGRMCVPRDCSNADEKSARASRTDFWQRRSSGEQKVAGLQTVQRHVLQHNGRGTDWALLAAFGAPGSGAKNPVPGGRIADAHRTHCC